MDFEQFKFMLDNDITDVDIVEVDIIPVIFTFEHEHEHKNKHSHYVFEVNTEPEFTSKLRLHVTFDDKYYGTGAGCNKHKFTNLNQWRLLTDEKDKVYLVRVLNIESTIHNIPVEVNICPCISKSTGELNAGIILFGSEDKLQQIVNKRLHDRHPDAVVELMIVNIGDVIDKKEYNDYKISYVATHVIKKFSNRPHLFIILGLDKNNVLTIGAGKRHPFESSKQCAIRELREEFSLETMIPLNQKPLVICGLNFYLGY
jgi:hypothetical protein